ncbi:MAG: restriction endonuclease subunit S, partial [Candidatus Bipolaricaulota bacterium]
CNFIVTLEAFTHNILHDHIDYEKGNNPNETKDYKDGNFNVPYLSMEFLRELQNNPSFANEQEQLVTVKPDDILLLWDGSKAGEFIRGKHGALSSTMAKLFNLGNNNWDYIYYLLKIHEDYLQNNTRGMGIPHVDTKLLKNLSLPIPPVKEQKMIAKFLDRETSRIDRLIEKKEKLIDLLEEKRTALISKTVTKGLDPGVEMVESGEEIIGEIPAHWDISTLGNISLKLTNGYVGPTRDIFVEDGIPYIQSTHIEDGQIKFEGEYFVSKEWSQKHSNSTLKKGDVLIVQTGDVGECAVVPKNLEGANCHALIIARTANVIDGLYLNLFLQSNIGKDLLNSLQTGATLKHLNTTRVKDVIIPIPPKEEQDKVINYLKGEQRDKEKMIMDITKGIDLLQEYRAALISAAVTGKIDVRGEV